MIPEFIQTVEKTLNKLGIYYITPEHLRQAKSNQKEVTDDLWRCLNDLVLIILLEFNHVVENIETAWNQQLNKYSMGGKDIVLDNCIEMIKVYFMEWGYLSKTFYTMKRIESSSSLQLLIALGWLMSRWNIFDHANNQIYKETTTTTTTTKKEKEKEKEEDQLSIFIPLPPYPSYEITLNFNEWKKVALNQSISSSLSSLSSSSLLSCWEINNRIIYLYGFIQQQLKHVYAIENSYSNLIQQIESIQKKYFFKGLNEMENKSNILSSYELNLIFNPSFCKLHVNRINQRIEQYEHEQKFYKWIGQVCKDYGKTALQKKHQHHQYHPHQQQEEEEEEEEEDVEDNANEVKENDKENHKISNRLQHILDELKEIKSNFLKDNHKKILECLWKEMKMKIGDMEYRRKKYKLKAACEKIDLEFPNINEIYSTKQIYHQSIHPSLSINFLNDKKKNYLIDMNNYHNHSSVDMDEKEMMGEIFQMLMEHPDQNTILFM